MWMLTFDIEQLTCGRVTSVVVPCHGTIGVCNVARLSVLTVGFASVADRGRT